jgi:hypothetical protein
MLDVLVASRPSRLLHSREILGSSILHVAMLTSAVLAGRVSVPANIRPVVDTTMVFIPRLMTPVADRQIAREARGGGRSGGGGHGSGVILISANPPALGFQVVAAVGSVPTEIPPVDLNQRILDPRDFTGRGVEGGTGWGVVGGSGPADQAEYGTEVKDLLYEASIDDRRFSPAELVKSPVFEHPRLLVEAGIAGRVVLKFIIDTTGRIEPTSIKVLEESHPLYAQSAVAGVVSAEFRPAHFGAAAVRQLTRLPVNFAVSAGN